MAKIDDHLLPWFKCVPSKLLGALSGMQPHEGYVYVVVLLRIYETDGRCSDTDQVLSRRTGLSTRKVSEAISLLIEKGKLTRSEAGLGNPFADTVLNEREKRKSDAQNSGKTGAEKRWGKSKKNQHSGYGDPKALPIANDAEEEGRRKKKKVKGPPSPQGGGVAVNHVAADFESFYAAYPKKENRRAAQSRYEKARKDGINAATILSGVHAYRRSVAYTERRYIKAPDVWLNKGCWDDDYGPPPTRPESKIVTLSDMMAERMNGHEQQPSDDHDGPTIDLVAEHPGPPARSRGR